MNCYHSETSVSMERAVWLRPCKMKSVAWLIIISWRCWGIFFTFLARDSRNRRRWTQFGPFLMFLAHLKIRAGPKLGLDPQSGLQIPELFSAPHAGTFFFFAFFVSFPGSSKNNVDLADPTLVFSVPGNSTDNVDKEQTWHSWVRQECQVCVFVDVIFRDSWKFKKILCGQRGRHYFLNFLDMRRNTRRKKFRNGAQKKVPESVGLVRDVLAVL